MNLRGINFVDKLEFEFPGNISTNAVTLGDVDNDNANELIVGNLSGDLAVFKGDNVKPLAGAQDLGMITTVMVGDVMNVGKNCLTVVTGDGWCYIFDNIQLSNSFEGEKQKLVPFHKQQFPANVKSGLLADVDEDGSVELVLALTDRVVRTYRWVSNPQGGMGRLPGKLIGIHKWEFANQIGNISIHSTEQGATCILIAQPGGTFAKLECTLEGPIDGQEENEPESTKRMIMKLTPEQHPLASSRMRNPTITTSIIGNVKGHKQGLYTNSLMALATLDGTLILTDVKDEILWSIQVDHQLFTLGKLDLTGDGREEVIACSWDGLTYIVNEERQSLRFQFQEPVCAFTTGYYSVSPGQPSLPCLVYATFSDRVFLYYNVHLPSLHIDTLQEMMDEKPYTMEFLQQLPIDVSDPHKVQELYHWCLYGFIPSRLRKKSTV